MIIACKSCSQMSVDSSNRSNEASRGKGESRSGSEPDTASLHKREWPTIQSRRSPKLAVKEQVEAAVRLPGVIEDGAYRKRVQELGRPFGESGRNGQHRAGKHNRSSGSARESERLIVVRKFRNWNGAKGPYCE